MSPVLRLMRPTHWLKNALVLVPLLFSGEAANPRSLACALFAFAAFCLAASSIYTVNDLLDVEGDRRHPTKRLRPIASGEVSPSLATLLASALGGGALAISLSLSARASVTLALFIALNLAYSARLKRVPLLDVTVLASGYLLRVLFGAFACGVDVSGWLYLTVLAGSFYLGLGKRRGELDSAGSGSRPALLGYTRDFLDKNMHVMMGLALGFYALWAREGGLRLWTVPLAMLALMRYSLDVERGGDADPMGVVTSDPWLLALGAAWAVAAVVTVYV